jgi:hypothetical protein
MLTNPVGRKGGKDLAEITFLILPRQVAREWHSEIYAHVSISYPFLQAGFTELPDIQWRPLACHMFDFSRFTTTPIV